MADGKDKYVTKEYYTISADDLKTKVNTYIDLQAKTEWVQLVSSRCLDEIDASTMFKLDKGILPPFYIENANRKSRYLLGFFLRLYLNWKWETAEDEDVWLMPYEEYDKWMRGHIFAQIEKFKSDKDVKDICFNLLAEYKDAERRLNSEIYGLLQVLNDPTSRQIAAQIASTSPEAIEQLFDSLEEAKTALDNYKELKQQKEEGTEDNG